jgi:uncharacterized protein with HEPN domain
VFSEKERNALRDIVDFVDEVDDFTQGVSFRDFQGDRKTLRAVERSLANLTEAAIRIGEARWQALIGEVAFHRVRGLGNRLRHEYDRLDARSIYELIQIELPPLRAACVAALDRA